ncbi:hypothetical protein F0344_00905 [Streptomyces finlayi]|uniref:Uncharacterized protein n=1 Tax=Streptomyces finlayi TaxID=67296 RepID=A0A7G7BDF9_9ACTN|nr:hypothetical protein [Streptomyces finlayi]QNE73374.1 hypothetical protein F0344_00905 [Streptomyces finlayi]
MSDTTTTDPLAGFRVTADDVQDFADALRRPPAELKPLLGLAFDGEVRTVAQGRVVFAGKPLLEVTAPLWDEEPPTGADPLLRTVMRDGSRIGPRDDLAAAYERFVDDIAALPVSARRIRDPEPPEPTVSRGLAALTGTVRRDLEARVLGRPDHGGHRGTSNCKAHPS